MTTSDDLMVMLGYAPGRPSRYRGRRRREWRVVGALAIVTTLVLAAFVGSVIGVAIGAALI